MATKVKLIADGVITPDQITLTTASTGTNTTAPATTAFVQQEISALVDSSPDALNTLNELAAALGNDENFSTTVTNSIATKLPLAGGALTGNLSIGDSSSRSFALYIENAGSAGAGQLMLVDSDNDTLQREIRTDAGVLSFDYWDSSNRSNHLTILANGNVGIGTDNPTHLLHLESNVPTIKFTESDTSTNAFIQNTGGNLRLYADDGDSTANTIIGFHVDSLEKMIIDSSGALGLGTTPPTTNTHPQFFIGAESFILGSTGGALDIGNNLYYNSGWKHRTTGAASLLNFDGSGNLVFYNVASAAADSAATLDEAIRITSDGKVGIGTGTNPGTGLHVKTPGVSAITAIFERSDAAGSYVQLKGNGSNGHQIGSTTDGLQIYDDESATYIAKFNNNTNDHNLQKWCYAEFDVYDNGSADAWEEKANLAANVYSLYGANINPGKYGNNLYYVGVGRENTDEAYVEFKVDLVEARSIYAYFGVSNSADGSTRYARLWYSYDGEVYTQVANNSFGAGGTSADYTLNLTSVLHHGDGDFTGSVYFRCGLMDSASQHSTLIGWTDFKFKAYAESMTFDGRYKRGSSSTSLVDNSGGGQETNFVPKVPYVHTFTLTSAGASSIETNNGGNGQFTSANNSYLNKEIFQIVSSPTHGIQCLTEGTIFYTVHQDLRTTGSTGYARVYVQRVNSTASTNISVGMHLTTNTGTEWDSISGQGSFDVVAGDIIRFNYAANGINSMDAGSWSYYTLMYLPHTTSFKGYANGNTSFPFAGGI